MNAVPRADDHVADDRVADARRRLTEATRASRLARIEAAEPLRVRARRRSAVVRVIVAGAVVVALVLAGLLVAAGMAHHSATRRAATDADVLDAARSAMTTLLSANPRDPNGYVDRALSVTTGAQHDRLTAARDALATEIAAQPRPSTGQILAAGLVDDPPSDDTGAHARVLVVAEATNPELVGGDSAEGQVTVDLEMLRTDAGWRIGKAQLA